MKYYILEIQVLLPDGKTAWYPVLRFDQGAQNGLNAPIPATFFTARDARDWQRLCLPDRARVTEADEPGDGPVYAPRSPAEEPPKE